MAADLVAGIDVVVGVAGELGFEKDLKRNLSRRSGI